MADDDESNSKSNAIKSLILWNNGVVMAFDYVGRQMSDYQGRVSFDLIEKLLEAVGSATQYEAGSWRGHRARLSKEGFFERLHAFAEHRDLRSDAGGGSGD